MSGVNFNRLFNQALGWAKLIGEVGVRSTYNILIMGGKEIQKQYQLYIQKHGKPAVPFSSHDAHVKHTPLKSPPKPPPPESTQKK